jgi:hypothetical protein
MRDGNRARHDKPAANLGLLRRAVIIKLGLQIIEIPAKT